MVLARITGVIGVGRNFIKFEVETLGSSFRDEIPCKKDDHFFFSGCFPPFLLSSLQVFLLSQVLEINERLCRCRGREDCQLIVGRLFAICLEV